MEIWQELVTKRRKLQLKKLELRTMSKNIDKTVKDRNQVFHRAQWQLNENKKMEEELIKLRKPVKALETDVHRLSDRKWGREHQLEQKEGGESEDEEGTSEATQMGRVERLQYTIQQRSSEK
ncbi:hypothetical protein B9Z55_002552 [Caenorhabditis nigoni]|nr:hypothetical protein B9Z55_002552 [Caenorhabditis nigoni]